MIYNQNIQKSGEKGKYVEHKNFLRTIREFPAYNLFASGEASNIVELIWNDFKLTSSNSELVNEFNHIKHLFRINGHSPIVLLDATAQLELTHHLDDALSKEIAYRHSANATNITNIRDVFLRKMGFLPYESLYDFEFIAEMCRVWGVKIPVNDGTGQH